MKLRPEEISSVLSQELTNYDRNLEVESVGTILQVGDGIARVYGLQDVMAGEMVKFPGDIFGMVLNLDKCIGCHTCSVTCKNVWTSRPGVEYAWFNNVETKPGIGYPKEWENQDKWNGGWVRTAGGAIEPRQGGKWKLLMRIFADLNLPEIDDYYEPFTFDYGHLQSAPEMKAPPTARPRSLITG